MVKISVVIPVYNEEKNIVKILKKLNNQTLKREDYEIIIVDGNSKDKTRELAKKFGANKVIIQKSVGVGGARNDGFKEAKAKIVATIDCDVDISKNWLENCLKAFDKNKRCVAFGCRIFPIEDDIKSKIFVNILDKWYLFCDKLGITLLGGFCTVIKKDVFFKIGGYRDLDIAEDMELGLRLRKRGYKIKIDKNIKVGFSTRRFKKDGYLKVTFTWLKEGIRLFLLGKTKNIGYSKKEY